MPPGTRKGFLRDSLEVVGFAVLLITFFKTFAGQQFTIPSASMRNTLQIGDHVLVDKFLFALPFLVWWSHREGGDDDTDAQVPQGPGDVVRNFLDGALHGFTRTRWERTFTLPR